MHQCVYAKPSFDYNSADLSYYSAVVCAILGAFTGAIAGSVAALTQRAKVAIGTAVIGLFTIGVTYSIVISASLAPLCQLATLLWTLCSSFGIVVASLVGKAICNYQHGPL
jgi:hypothetical protein